MILSLTNFRHAGNRVCNPIAPKAALSKGNLLLSSSCGKWKELIVSKVLSLIFCNKNNLSEFDLSGGLSLKNVL